MQISQLLWTGSGLFSVFAVIAIIRTIVRFAPCSKSWTKARLVLTIMSYQFLWYTISICFTLFNKWLFTEFDGGKGCPFPVLLTCGHVALKGLLAASTLGVCLRRNPLTAWKSMGWKRYIAKAAPIGVFTSLDIAMSNAAFIFISVSFYTVIKTSSIINVLILSMALCLQRCSMLIIGIICVVACGVALASMGELHFRIEGLLLVLGAGMSGSLRWVITQMLVSNTRVNPAEQCKCCVACCTKLGCATPEWCQAYANELKGNATGASGGSSNSGSGGESGGGIAMAGLAASDGNAARNGEREAEGGSSEEEDGTIAWGDIHDGGGALADADEDADMESAGGRGESEGGAAAAATTEVVKTETTVAAVDDTQPPHKFGAVETVMFISPSAVLTLLPYALCVELPKLFTSGLSIEALQYLPLMIVIGGVLAFFLLLIETELVQITSSLTLSVIGNLKDCLQITIVVVVFGEEISPLNVIGLVLALSGIAAYNIAKQVELCQEAKAVRESAQGEFEKVAGSTPCRGEESEDEDEVVIDFTGGGRGRGFTLDDDLDEVVGGGGGGGIRRRRMSYTPQSGLADVFHSTEVAL